MKIKLAGLVVLMCVFVGCSSDTKTNSNKEAKVLKNTKENLDTKKNKGEAMSTSITVSEFLNDRYDGKQEIVEKLTVKVKEKGEQGKQEVYKVAVEGNDMMDIYLTANPETLEIIHFTEFNWESGTMAFNNFENAGEIRTLPLNDPENNFFFLHRNDPLKELADRPEFGM